MRLLAFKNDKKSERKVYKEMKKRFTAVLLSLMLMSGLMPATAFAADPEGVWTDYAAEVFAGGTGTQDDPYLVETAEQLAKVAKDVNDGTTEYDGVSFRLEDDIDLSAHYWRPIGCFLTSSDNRTFRGNIDGNDKTITGLTVDESERELQAGFFGKIGNSTTGVTAGAKNLTISGASIYTREKNLYPSAGILAGYAQANEGHQIVFENIRVSGSVEIAMTDGAISAGGMFGYADRIQAVNCKAENIFVSGSSNSGGFVGSTGDSVYQNCSALGTVHGAWNLGGFAGYTSSTSESEIVQSTFDHCTADVDIEGSDWRLGGFTGSAECGIFKNCVAYGDVSSTVDGWEPKVGGFFGESLAAVEAEYCHAAGGVTSASSEYEAGGFVRTYAGGMYSECSFDNEKNPGLNAAGTGELESGITGEAGSLVMANICEDYYGSHQYSTELTVDKQPTCTEDGSQSYHCERCGDKKDSQIIPATGHDWGKPVWEWSEDYSGATVTFTCKNDNTHQEMPQVTVTESVVREATCTTDGEKNNIASATFNGGTYTDEQKVAIAAAGHQAGAAWKSDGEKHWNECTECGEKLNEAVHIFQWVTDKEATATEAGLRHEECTVCGYEKAAVEIPAAGTAENPTKPSKPSGTLKPGDTQTPPTSSTDTDIPSGGNQTGDKGSTDTGKTDSPQTGDDSNIVLWTVMMLAAGAALTGTLLYNRKKKCSR